MRLLDYIRLGSKGVKAHKKRATAVVVIVGLLFGVIMAGAFVLQGLENAVLGKMTAPTGGKVLVASTVELSFCGEECDAKAEVEVIKKNIAEYGGELIAAEVVQNADDVFYKIDAGVFSQASSSGDDEMRVFVSLTTAANIANIKMPAYDAEVSAKLRAINEVREKVLHQTVEGLAGEKYYTLEVLPGGVYGIDLALTNVGQKSNPLNLILGQVRTGTSQNFVINDVGTVEAELIFARFDNVKAAYDYYRDGVNYCAEIDRIFGTCGGNYRYRVFSAISDPLTTYENLQNVWLVFWIAVAVLAVVAIIIAISTYVRLISRDVKIIALYHAMGATRRQIRLVYITYLAILSLMAVMFALIVGLILAAGLSLVNMAALRQVFTLGFGTASGDIWLIGWNNLIWFIIGAMALAVILAVVLGSGNFREKELARKLK